MEDNIEGIFNILQHLYEIIPKVDDVGQGAHDGKISAHVEQPSINQHGLRGFDSNIGINQG